MRRKRFIFEFYEDEKFLGQVILDKADFEYLIQSENAIPYNVSNLGKQLKKITGKKSVNKTSGSFNKISSKSAGKPNQPNIKTKNKDRVIGKAYIHFIQNKKMKLLTICQKE